MTDDRAEALLEMTVGIVANFVANNRINPEDLSSLIVSTHTALSGAGKAISEPIDLAQKASAAQIRKSVTDAGLISFIDGRTYQSLKRHLGTHGFTPQSYREVFGLRSDYPMVSPVYAAKRSALAKAAGLGQGGRKPKTAVKTVANKPVGRPRKST